MSEETKKIAEKIVRLIEEILKIATIVCLVVALTLASMARNDAQERAEEQAALIREHKANEERLANELAAAIQHKTDTEKRITEEFMPISQFESLKNEIEDLQTIIKNQAKTIEEQERTIAIHTDTDPIPYTQEDIDILAAVMYGEEYPNRYEMMLAGSVVLNRVKDPQFPDTIKAVVYQFDGQYEQYAPRTKGFIGKDLPEECYRLAEILLRYGPIAPGEVIYQAHFNQGDVFWSWQGEEFCFGR